MSAGLNTVRQEKKCHRLKALYNKIKKLTTHWSNELDDKRGK